MQHYHYIDPIALAELTGGDKEFMQEMITQYLSVSDGYFQELTNAVAQGQSAEIVFQAHKIGGLYKMVSARSLAAITDEIEACCAPVVRADLIGPLLEELDLLSASTKYELRQFLSSVSLSNDGEYSREQVE